jgi:hypothetical protein
MTVFLQKDIFQNMSFIIIFSEEVVAADEEFSVMDIRVLGL